MSSGSRNECWSLVGIYDRPTPVNLGSDCYNKRKGKIHNGIAWTVLHEVTKLVKTYHKLR